MNNNTPSGQQPMDTDEAIKEAMDPWRKWIGAVWIFGIAILAWRGWWWPGILVLVGITMVIEGIARQKARKAYDHMVFENSAANQASANKKPRSERALPNEPTEPPGNTHPYELLPSACPRCGAAVRGEDVRWTGKRSADCAFCGASLPLQKE